MTNPEQKALQRIQTLIAALEDTAEASPARELLQVVMDLHSSGLDRMLEMVAGSDGGAALIERFTSEEAVNGLLLLHGLHPQDLETRVREAVARLRPHLAVQGIGVAELEIAGDVVRLTLREAEGRAGHKPPSAEALRREVEEAIFNVAPDVASLELQGLPVPTAYVPISNLGKGPPGAAANG